MPSDSPLAPSPRDASLLLLTGVGCGLVLAQFYAALGALTGLSLTTAAAICHTIVGLSCWWLLKGKGARLIRQGSCQTKPILWQDSPRWWAYTPALLVLLACLSLIAAGPGLGSLLHTVYELATTFSPASLRTFSVRESARSGAALWCLQVLWVPVVEELVFRVGLTGFLQHLTGQRLWAIYASVLTFSWLHSIPTYDRILAGESGFYCGPLVLAVCCEGLYAAWGRILPAIALHAACNASVILFADNYYPLPAWLLNLLSS